jgi:biotin synthase-like enzyme
MTTCAPAQPQVSTHAPAAQYPLGSKARVLLTSVFGPYAQDDQFGSRHMNPMELYHNQVTRVQGPFSLRMFHRSWGIMLIQANITAPTTVLDFPKLERFIQQISENEYDIIGITSIIPNIGKVEHMCKLIRQHQPNATIVIGGHLANFGGLSERADADHIVRGDGVRWFRNFLGEDANQPIKHPRILSAFGTRSLGITLPDKPGDVAATIIPSVGCPVGCNFCSTSAMFGGKGKSVIFFDTGDELFDVMCDLEKSLKVQSFFMMDENFLLHRKRALRLLELMKQHDKAWSLYVFTSANVLRSYTDEQLVGLGISWVWMGMEGKNSQYAKLSGTNTIELVKHLQSLGVRVLGSSIIGLEEHTPENIDDAIEFSALHDTEFHQFMLYTPIPGTMLWKQHEADGSLTDPHCLEAADTHGQLKFNYKHPHIPAGAETEMLVRAFTRDFKRNGPSVIRVIRTTLRGYKQFKNSPDARIRRRFEYDARGMSTTLAAAVWACRKWFKNDPHLHAKMNGVLQDIYQTFGIKARITAPLIGRYIFRCLKAEHARLATGWTYEPPTFCETTNQPNAKAAGKTNANNDVNSLAPLATAS